MFTPFGPRIEEISTAELQTRLEKGEKLVIIDVREPDEYAAGHVPGAVLKPLGQIQTWARELDKDEEILLFCRSGNRSSQAYRYLHSQGFTKLKNVAGGILDWRGPVEK